MLLQFEKMNFVLTSSPSESVLMLWYCLSGDIYVAKQCNGYLRRNREHKYMWVFDDVTGSQQSDRHSRYTGAFRLLHPQPRLKCSVEKEWMDGYPGSQVIILMCCNLYMVSDWKLHSEQIDSTARCIIVKACLFLISCQTGRQAIVVLHATARYKNKKPGRVLKLDLD